MVKILAGCRLQHVCLDELAKLSCRAFQTCDHVGAILTNAGCLIVQLIQEKLRAKMVLVNEKIVRCLTEHAEFAETIVGEMLCVLGDDGVSACHDRRSKNMPV